MGKKDTPTEAKSANIHVHPKVGEVCLRARHANVSEREAVEREAQKKGLSMTRFCSNKILSGITKTK